MVAASSERLAPGHVIAGHVVRGVLGQGGMGAVYEVDAPDGTRRALKVDVL